MSLWTDQGGYLASLNLSKELRTALKPGLRFRQFCDIKDPEQQGAMPEVVERMRAFGMEPLAGTPEQFHALARAEARR